MTFSGLNRACTLLGSQETLAAVLGIRSPSISGWRRAGAVPPDRCAEIERATGGAVTCEELRPDVPWIRGPNGEPLIDVARLRKEAA
jgi:DNA-binding transcriptional regulator YdaS (Cro superfamily)